MVDHPLTSQDIDPEETLEWKEALNSVIEYEDVPRAEFIINQLLNHAAKKGVTIPTGSHTPYINTLDASDSELLAIEDVAMTERLTNYMRWNALIMVLRVAKQKAGIGGHIGSYASIATLYEVGLNFFWKSDDMVLFQGHSAEGIYARAFLEGRLTEEHLINFRQEAFKDGISSYPHPHLMPEFWQFPTVSLGLGPIQAVYQAQFLKYLENRGLASTKQRKVWAFSGDGETGEPESKAGLLVASREKLDNLIYVINCNLQRLDGPVSGNGKIIQELEGVFKGAGWRVIKVIWGSEWEKLFQKDKTGLLLKRVNEMVDGDFQNCFAGDNGAMLRKQFFGKYPELLELVANLSDEDLCQLKLGGHDPQKVYAAYAEAVKDSGGKPTVILFQTIKGYGMGKEGQSQNIAHNMEGLSEAGLKSVRDRFQLPFKDEELAELPFFKPEQDADAIKYLLEKRRKLGGPLPARNTVFDALKTPQLQVFEPLLQGSGERSISTSAAFSRIMMILLKDKNIADRIVPIVADEARTLGVEGLFRQIGIYAVDGQKYTPEDKNKLIYYREDKAGQVLQQGISEAGAMSSWIAAGTSYSFNKLPMIPFYFYYAMFGFQRIGDFVWAAGDIQAHGFLLGGLAGRTTLAGEGLQHQDQHNYLMFGFVPSCHSYDPTFGYELAVIVQDGLRRMYQEKEPIFYYLTMMNEAYKQPAMPQGVEEDIVKGLYLFKGVTKKAKKQVQLIGSGAIFNEVIAAAEILEKKYGVSSNIWGATSFNLLRRDLESVQRYNRLHPDNKAKQSHAEICLNKCKAPVIAATDYMKLVPEQIRSAIKQPYYVLGTDGYGRSDTRAQLRNFFEVNANMIAYTALVAIAEQGDFSKADLKKAIRELDINPDRLDPWTV